MTITLITIEEFNNIKSIFEKYPNLTYKNVDYDTLQLSTLTPQEKEAFYTVQSFLKEKIKGFVKFNHFRFNANHNKIDNRIQLRFQYAWDSSFTGVGYIYLDELLNGFDDKK